MNRDCAIARDLMPQVIDHVASDESKTFVEEHMQTCQPCTQVYADMQAEIQGAEASSTGESTSFKAAMSQLKKTLNWKRIRTIVIAVLVTAVVLYTGHYFLFVEGGHALPNEDYEVELFQSEDNTVYVIPRFLKRINFHGVSSSFDTDSGIVYIHWMSARIPTGDKNPPRWYPHIIMRLTFADDGTLMYSDKYPVREIRKGTENDYVVAYQTGDPIPKLDPVIDEYIQQQEMLEAKLDTAYETMIDMERMHAEALLDFEDYINQWEDQQDTQATESPAP